VAAVALAVSTALLGVAGPAWAARPQLPAKTVPPINDLARTPYQGWNTYYGLGSDFNEQTIKNEADALVSRGLKAAGYNSCSACCRTA
jgi:alpha-galactosidase